MNDIASVRKPYRPAEPLTVAPIGQWPWNTKAIGKWLFSFPGYLWPYNLFLLGVTAATWAWLTPSLAGMETFEAWWVGVILARNAGLILLWFGGLHLFFYVFKGQGDELNMLNRPPTARSKRFLFKRQSFENAFLTLVFAVPVITAYEAVTYWAFANGYLNVFGIAPGGTAFWVWFVVLALAAPFIHAIHFYLGHRLLHVPLLYRKFHALHHKNVDVGPWSGLSMHPVEHIIYFSTICVQWALCAHPVNALFQLQIAALYPALGHAGHDKLKLGQKLAIDGGAYFHYLHHKYFECNYGGSLLPLDKFFGTFHDGTDEAQARLRERLREQRRGAA